MFVRTMLALSLSCIFAGTAIAASTAEQPLTPKKVTNVAVQDPIDPLATEASSATSQISAQEQEDLNQASQTLDSLQQSEDVKADIGAAPATSTATTPTSTSPAAKVAWGLNDLNNAQWYDNIGKGQFPVYARAHVMLNNAHASPGAIDGTSGKNTLKAIASFQQMNGLKPTGTLTKETWDALIAKQGSKPAFIEYTLTDADLKGPYAASIPHDYALQAKMKGLYYTRVTEMLGEKFHMDEDFLKKLNPKATFKKAGEKILVANIRNEVPEDIHLIVAHKGAKQLYLFNSRNQMIRFIPCNDW
jgi:Putative peptidoglycan-binding domain-containing protein